MPTLQAGEDGSVFTPTGARRTAFFEAFPTRTERFSNAIDTYIRGEGATMTEAEANAWAKWQKIVTCPGHEWETRGYTNGGQFCKHCGMFVTKKSLESAP